MTGRAAVEYAVVLVELVFLDVVLRAEVELAVVEAEEDEVVFLKLPCVEGMLTMADGHAVVQPSRMLYRAHVGVVFLYEISSLKKLKT